MSYYIFFFFNRGGKKLKRKRGRGEGRINDYFSKGRNDIFINYVILIKITYTSIF